jgi:hypothetical protein
MRNANRVLCGLFGVGLFALCACLSLGQSQPSSVGNSVATLTRHSMKLAANGLTVSVYPRDPLHPYDSSDWVVEVPVTVTDVRYEKDRQELLVAVNYNWRRSDEECVRAQLAWKYKAAGKPVPPEAITITPLEVSGHSLLVRDMDKEYLLFDTNKPTRLTTQTVAFRVPMVSGAERLHERLSTVPEAVQLVFRAGYRFDRIAGLTVERRALASAWDKVLESVMPHKAPRAESLLVDRDAEQTLQKMLAKELTTIVKSYGLTSAEETDAIRLAMSQIEKLTVPSSPLSVNELLELEQSSMVYTAASGKIEAKPATNEEVITKLKECQSLSKNIASVAESISDIANNTSLDDRKFHSSARKNVIDAGASGGFLCFNARANFHLDKDEQQIDESDLKDIKIARTYAVNKSAYSRDVQESNSREIEGLLKKSGSTAPLLRLRRVSAGSLAAMAMHGWSVVRVTGSDVVFIDTPIALRATPTPARDDVVLDMEKRLRKAEDLVVESQSRLDKMNQRLEKTEKRQYKVLVSPEPLLGIAQDKAANTQHTAESDGIVVVYAGGNTPPQFQMTAGGKLLGQFTAGYVTGTMAVQKGASWQVTAIDSKNNPIPAQGLVVRFIPISLPKFEVIAK